jgi:hypothetical protein
MERPTDINMEEAKIAYVLFLMMMMMGRKWPDMICICVIYIGHDRNKRHWIGTTMRRVILQSQPLLKILHSVYIM